MSESANSDAQQLAQFGYKQELHRTLGSFSSFAAGFSYISILTGMFQTSALGFLFAGPAFAWFWLVVLFGQFMVALQFAELSAHYPLAGSVYQWSKQARRQVVGVEHRLDVPVRPDRDGPGRRAGVADHPAADLAQVPDLRLVCQLAELLQHRLRRERGHPRPDHGVPDDDHQRRRRQRALAHQQHRRRLRAGRGRRPDHPVPDPRQPQPVGRAHQHGRHWAPGTNGGTSARSSSGRSCPST